jgi:hypothetical protein
MVVGNPGTPPTFEGGAFQQDISGKRGASEASVGKY